MFAKNLFALFVAMCSMFMLSMADVGTYPLTVEERHAAYEVKSALTTENVQKSLKRAQREGSVASPAGTLDNSPGRTAAAATKKKL
mmetsp:Transcript_5758/g.7774  ORF Transcript_5758/g.7774 Transcript_5758/m.7774 type:complete len:86 (+) Transcript_5758:47-304(+)